MMTKEEAQARRRSLQGADLRNAFLKDANLQGADLRFADLQGADLRFADLRGACLIDADLQGADLRFADLRGACLIDADLQGADLRGACLLHAELFGVKNFPEREIAKRQIVPAGELIVYKQLACGAIATLRIPIDALRVGGIIGRKCRASQAIVVEGYGYSFYNASYRYYVGKVCEPCAPFNSNPLIECASGIHFFLTREEAEGYDD